MLRLFLTNRVRQLVDFLSRVGSVSNNFPPPSFNLIPIAPLLPSYSNREIDSSAAVREKRREVSTISELLGIDFGVLWGVPVSRTTKQTRSARRRSFQYLIKPKRNLVMCQTCGDWRELHTICGGCYAKVREETAKIKEKLLAFANLYTSSGKTALPDRESILLYKGENVPKDEAGVFWQGKRIVEIDRERPAWFSADLKKRWQFLANPLEKPK